MREREARQPPPEDGLTAWRRKHAERSLEWRRQAAEREADEREDERNADANLRAWFDWYTDDQLIPITAEALALFRRDIDTDTKALWVSVTRLKAEIAELRSRNVTTLPPRKNHDAA